MPIYKMQGKKDGLQKYRVRINYTDNAGQAHQLDRVAYGLDAAKELERQLSAKYANGAAQLNCTITVQKLYDEYISAKKPEVRESTLYKSKQTLTAHVLPFLGNVKITALSAPILQKWKLSIEERGFTLKTRQNIYSEFRALLMFAVKMEYLNINPLKRVGNFKDAYQEHKDICFYTAEEFKQFIAAAKNEAEMREFTEWNYYVFFCIAFYTGMRKGEIYALRWNDIKDNTLQVRRSITQKLGSGDRETPPKNKSSVRDIQMPVPLIKVLDEHKKRYIAVEGFSPNWHICGGEKCIRDTSVSNKNIRYSQLAKVKTIRIHDFRHSHASLLANEGINIQEVSRRLGHANIEMTWNTYSHLYPREEERALKVLNEIV